jgi:hypothetical protein
MNGRGGFGSGGARLVLAPSESWKCHDQGKQHRALQPLHTCVVGIHCDLLTVGTVNSYSGFRGKNVTNPTSAWETLTTFNLMGECLGLLRHRNRGASKILLHAAGQVNNYFIFDLR